jgi:hypothetical protein
MLVLHFEYDMLILFDQKYYWSLSLIKFGCICVLFLLYILSEELWI